MGAAHTLKEDSFGQKWQIWRTEAAAEGVTWNNRSKAANIKSSFKMPLQLLIPDMHLCACACLRQTPLHMLPVFPINSAIQTWTYNTYVYFVSVSPSVSLPAKSRKFGAAANFPGISYWGAGGKLPRDHECVIWHLPPWRKQIIRRNSQCKMRHVIHPKKI